MSEKQHGPSVARSLDSLPEVLRFSNDGIALWCRQTCLLVVGCAETTANARDW